MTQPIVVVTDVEAFEVGARYRALASTVSNHDLPLSVRTPANKALAELKDTVFRVMVGCVICREFTPHEVNAFEIATWTDKPRGLCGTCANKSS